MSKNMKKMIMAMSLALASVAPLTQAAGIGVIDLERVVEGSTYLKQQNTAFQQKIQPQTSKIEQLSKELEALQQRAQSNTKLSDAEKQKMSTQYQAKFQELNQLQQSVQNNVQSSIQQIRTVFDARVKQIAEQLRKENNLDVALNKNSALAYDANYDLTDKMIQKVNAIKYSMNHQQLQLADLARLVQGECVGQADLRLSALASLEHATSQDLAFVNADKYV